MKREVTSRSIQGISDLVVCAPIKRGFIDSFENVTYETRFRLATQAFNALRDAAREYETIKPFTDVAERIQSLLAFRIGVIDTTPQPSMILAATFDSAWEPYIRLIWRPLGVFLDVLLCNCEGYVTAYDHSFAEYAQWVRDHQVDSDIFYATTPLTVTDQLYLIKFEHLQRAGDVGGATSLDRTLAGMTSDNPITLSADVRAQATAAGASEQQGQTPTAAELEIQRKFLTLASEALVVLYRLADYYPPGRPGSDSAYLRRAAKDIFDQWPSADPAQLPPPIHQRFKPMFDWLTLKDPDPPPAPPDPVFHATDVQGGILTSYDQSGAPLQNGALLMFSVTDAARARVFIAGLLGEISVEGDTEPRGDLGAFLNLAVTANGLQRLGVPDDVFRAFPKEFRDGMDARAPLMGDIGPNHPRNWPLQRRFAAAPDDFRPRVELSEIDVILQLRTAAGDWSFVDLPDTAEELAASDHPLKEAALRLWKTGEQNGASLVALQPMRRMRDASAPAGALVMRDHFGFKDEVSQPALADQAPIQRDLVKRGELLLGYANDRGDPPGPDNPFLRDGTFLVVRKMRQKADVLRDFLDRPTGANAAVSGDALAAKMVGRTRDGVPLIAGAAPGDNDFDFSGDPRGEQCPLSAHIRRVNPRVTTFGRPTPRILRRSMSYGPTLEEGPDAAERGIVFMAYAASIAEQFETMQRWVNGGNSTSVASAQNDPLIGVQPADGPKTFRFLDGGNVVRVDMPEAFVGLEWGLYLFVPSLRALQALAAGPPRPAAIGDPVNGEALIARMAALPPEESRLAWKTYLEDFIPKDPKQDADTPDIWAAIRENHQGVLRTPQGVLVASQRLVDQVYLDPLGRYSVSGQAERMRHSFGEIFIGLDPGPDYEAQSTAANAAIMAVSREAAFEVAYQAATRVLEYIADQRVLISAHMGVTYPIELDLRREFIAPTLAAICQVWFGLPDFIGPGDAPPGACVRDGDFSWADPSGRIPQCPGDYFAPSRYCFYPDPTATIVDYGQAHGQALRAAGRRFIEGLRAAPAGAGLPPLAAAILGSSPDDDLVARTLIGVMTGALPPIDGNLRAVLYEWLQEKTFWRFQRTLGSAPPDLFAWAQENLESPMKAAMQKRPAPDLLWRTVTQPHWLGAERLEAGDKVIVSVVSATLEQQNAGRDDVMAVFGGDRHAAPHAVHACPAYHMSVGTMLGILTALCQAGEIQALPQPFLVRILKPGDRID